jgi:hypothetical protein
MSERSFSASESDSAAVRERPSLTAVASGKFVFDAPELKSATVIVTDAAPALGELEQIDGAARISKSRSVWIFVAGLVTSIMLIVLAIVAAALYL